MPVEITSIFQLNHWCSQNGVTPTFKSFIRHKENHAVYGSLFETEKGLLFQQHKWTEINKAKPSPKVCAEIQYSHKFVSQEIFNSFEVIQENEYLECEMEDYNKPIES